MHDRTTTNDTRDNNSPVSSTAAETAYQTTTRRLPHDGLLALARGPGDLAWLDARRSTSAALGSRLTTRPASDEDMMETGR